ncbi:hypothetical protein OIDMADRAFT_30332 [Oidiodendron maius Zn]|uniref:Uncharacterized protein n=1 Tax=Oidiodendron maius (strain Zn) TaxID=913774 RepID=A0A0C3CLR2_OIDMZ|nr:hypothetical protein OIDMADRAFT_30332 [Oidiodendron maius Zn]
MVPLKDVQGRVYKFKSRSECLGLGLGIPTLDVPDVVRSHMVLVLDIVPGKLDYVKVMTITSTPKDNRDYVPISPTPKKGFAIQLRLRNRPGWYHGDAVLFFTILPKNSYLKIDSYYEVPIQVLVEAKDKLGNPLMVWPKHQGGLGELRDHVRRCDLIRGRDKLYHMTEKPSEEEDDV